MSKIVKSEVIPTDLRSGSRPRHAEVSIGPGDDNGISILSDIGIDVRSQ